MIDDARFQEALDACISLDDATREKLRSHWGGMSDFGKEKIYEKLAECVRLESRMMQDTLKTMQTEDRMKHVRTEQAQTRAKVEELKKMLEDV